MTPTWHADPEVLDAYLDGRVDAANAASIEAHLMNCATCRQAVAEATPDEVLQGSWLQVERRVDAKVRSRLERMLLRSGVPDGDARLLAATPSLQGPWLVAVAVTLLLAALTASARPTLSSDVASLFFLAVAPLVPLAGVALAYSPEADPTHELLITVPTSRLRLLGVRASAVFLTSAVLGVAAGLLLPGPWWRATAWLLPALALSASALVVGRTRSPAVTSIVLGVAWLAGVTGWALAGDDRLAPFRAPAQVGYLAVAIAAVAIALTRDQDQTALAPRRTR